jgi:hypothetical protein
MRASFQYYLDWLLTYRDYQGLLVNKSGDGGDSAHNAGIFYISAAQLHDKSDTGAFIDYDARRDLLMYAVYENNQSTGKYCRHPDESKWYSKAKYMSRDQLKSLMALMVYFGFKKELAEVFESLKGNNFLHFNTEESDYPYTKKFPDLISPTQLRFFITELPNLWYLKPLVIILDLDLIFGATIGLKKWDSGIKTFTELLAIEKSNSHSLLSRLTAYILKKRNIGQQLEDAYTKHSLDIEPLGYIVRAAYEAWREKTR